MSGFAVLNTTYLDVEGEMVLHYGTASNSISAETFAKSLEALHTLVKEIGYYKYPDLGIELSVEALAEGSFRAKVKNIYTGLKPYAPAKDQTLPIVLALIALIQVELHSSDSTKVSVTINGDKASVQVQDTTVIINRDTLEDAQKVRANRTVSESVKKHFEVLDNDQSITNFGFAREVNDKNNLLLINRTDFNRIANRVEDKAEKRELIEEDQQLDLIKIVLQKGPRKWEFGWRGVKISATVNDDDFWQALSKREIQISQGDYLKADLKVTQVLDPIANVYLNEKYEIIKIRSHKQPMRQFPLI